MNTTNKNNSILNKNPNRNSVMNEEFYNFNDEKETDKNAEEIANRGYTVRNGHNPNKPNPDEKSFDYGEYLDDEEDDFHNQSDLEDHDNDVYEVELENEDEYIQEDFDNEVENDEFDNPSDTFENDFNETEDDLEDIDQDDDDFNNDAYDNDDDATYLEDDVQEEDDDYEDSRR